MLIEILFKYILIIAMSYRTAEYFLVGSLASHQHLTQPEVIHLNPTQSSCIPTELM